MSCKKMQTSKRLKQTATTEVPQARQPRPVPSETVQLRRRDRPEVEGLTPCGLHFPDYTRALGNYVFLTSFLLFS